MAKKKTASKKYTNKKDDKNLMILAGTAVIIVAIFAIFAYRSSNVVPLPTPTPSSYSVQLGQQNKSTEDGTAMLEEVNGKVVVTLSVTNEPKGATQPAHIHIGSCPNPGAVKYPLTSVINGRSVTTLNLSLSELKSMGPLAINVHKSAALINTYVSCGDLKF